MSGWKTPSTTIRTGLVTAGLVAQLITSLPAFSADRAAIHNASPLAEPPRISQEAPSESQRGKISQRRLPSALLAEPPAVEYRVRRLAPGVKPGGGSTLPVLLAEPAVIRPMAAVTKAAAGLTGVSVNPTGGSSTSQTFVFTYTDPAVNGADDLRYVEALLNSNLTGAGACFLHYDLPSNGLYLRTDANDNWLGPVTPGTNAFLSNSQCSVNAAGVSVAKTGTNLSLAVPLTFTNSFAGTRTIYLIPVDLAGNFPPSWLAAGVWNVPSNNTNVAPTVTGVTPNGGTGTTQTFSFAYADAAGFSDIFFTEALINTSLNGSNGCFIHYDRASNGLYLRDDANSYWQGPLTPGVPGSIGNSQCAIQGAGSSVTANGNNLVVNVNTVFSATFTGTKNLYMIAVNSALTPVNWTNAGTWTVGTPPPNQAPTALSVSPVASSGSGATFTFTYSDPNGFTDIRYVEALFSANPTLANTCFIHYDRPTNALYLRNDASDGWLGPVTLGSASTIANSQCSINAGGSFVSTTGSTLSLTVPVTFSSSFNGGKVIYLTAVDNSNLTSGPVNIGSFTVNASGGTGGGTGNIPYGVSANPSNGGGLSQIFNFTYGDPAGYTDLSYVEALVNSTVNGAGACFLHLNRADNGIYLRNDQNTGWSGPLYPNQVATLSNSQCTVSGQGTTVVGNGNTLTFSPNVTFAAGFAGLKNLYLTAVSNGGLYPTWQSFGTYNVNGTGTGGGTGQVVAATSVSPASGSGLTQLFTFNYSDTLGVADIHQVQAIFTTPGTGQSCTVTYVPSSNQLFLAPDSGATLLGPVTPGSANGVLTNSVCSVNATSSSTGQSGTNLSLFLSMTFYQNTFAGTKTVSGSIQSNSLGSQTFTTQLGTFTVGTGSTGTSNPFAVSLQYVPGSGFVAVFRNPAGYQALSSEDLLVNSTFSGVNGCWIHYDAVANLVYLRNNTNTGWLGGYRPGDASTPSVSNTQCTVNTQLFQTSGNGTDVTDKFTVTLSPALYGQQTVFLWATDTAGNQSTPAGLLTTTFP